MGNCLKRAIVVGASSGIGEALTLMLAERGVQVAAIARREGKLQSLARQFPDFIIPFPYDVCSQEDIARVFQEITKCLGGLDALYYVAGVMPEVEIDEYDTSKDRSTVETNVIGCIAWCNEAAARFAGVGAGAIVGISSVAGDRGRPGQPVYNASKAAASTYLEALRNRLAPKGVKVTTIKPGPVDTPMTATKEVPGKMPVEECAAKVIASTFAGKAVYLKLTHRLIFAVVRLLPSWAVRRLPF